MGILDLERQKTVTLMPHGFTEEEALEVASYRASQGDFNPVIVDDVYPTVEVTERTLLGKVVHLGKRVVTYTQKGVK